MEISLTANAGTLIDKESFRFFCDKCGFTGTLNEPMIPVCPECNKNLTLVIYNVNREAAPATISIGY